MILAIDQSTSATKALLFDDDAGLLDKASREHRQIYPRPGRVEHDAEEIWRNTIASCRELLARHDPAKVEQVSLANQRETFVVLDRETGRPLHHAIVWQDRRGDGICEQVRERGAGGRVASLSGLRVDSYFSGPKMAWLLREDRSIAAAARAGRAVFATMDAYLVCRLTGGRRCAGDHTNASRTLLFDIHSLDWSDELCGMFEVPRAALPDVLDSTAGFGTTTLEGLLPRAVPIRGVMGDSQASLLGQCCVGPGAVKATLGTGTSILLNTAGTPRLDNPGGLATVAWTHRGRATYCLEGVISYSAATIAWLKDQLGLIDRLDEVEPLAGSVADSGGVYLVPAFAGLSAPHWSPGAKAAIVGLSGHSTKAHVVRAAIESIGFQLHDALAAMRQGGDVPTDTIRLDGGATRNRLLVQFIADLLGIEVRVSEIAECSPRGAVIAGLVGSGHLSSMDDATRLAPRSMAYQPDMSREQAAELLAGWSRAVRQVLAGT